MRRLHPSVDLLADHTLECRRAMQSSTPRRRDQVAGICLGIFLLLASAGPAVEPSVSGTIDDTVARMQAALTPDQLLRLDEPTVQRFLTPEDRQVLATQYWHFEVNLPAVVSVMRDAAQAELPFWLPEYGFRRTELKVANAEFEYEVWQKRFPPGRVGLGINGFAKHRPHYFVCVGPQEVGARLELTHFFPADQQVLEMRPGALIYHDWPELQLTRVPDELKGQKLLPTIRGRAREAHLVQAFRKTPFAASPRPDQVVLTWSEDPRTTQTIQWRAASSVKEGMVRYRAKEAPAAADWKQTQARCEEIDDRLLVNDRRVNHFTAVLRGLKPSTTYVYSVGGPADALRSEPAEFTTAPTANAPFGFVFLSDTHNHAQVADLLAHAVQHYPETAFCTISGDLVAVGQYRDDWDQFFNSTRNFANRRPLVPVVGNHDTIDGLGAHLYLSFFGLPTNGPARVEPGRTYSFQYANAQFLMLDATSPVEDQAPWIQAQLAQSRATWKFALLHFPPYAPDDDNPDILRHWCPLFDQYHVDFVLSGHVHHFLRTYPLKNGQQVNSLAEGTVYLLTVAVPHRPLASPKPSYAAAVDGSGLPLYQVFTIAGNRLVTRSCDLEGNVRDEFVIKK